jgi:glycosidase
MKRMKARWVILLMLGLGWGAGPARAGEVVLQYFNTSWSEIARRIPELAEAGYNALWLPPPFKAGGALSVGFDTYDRFDLGSRYQNGTITTKYGTETELLNLMEVAHRFGFRVYFDNVMAHNGGPGMSGAPGTLNAVGFVPEDFHLKRTSATTYEGNGWPAWSDEWQVLNRNPFGLDIAQENPNTSFGYNEGDDFPKWFGVRHPNRPEYYLDTDLPFQAVNGNVTSTVYTFANKEPYLDVGYTNLATVFVSNAVGNGRFDWEDGNANGQHDAGERAEPFTDTGIDPSRADHLTAAWGHGNGRYDMGNPGTEDVNSMLYRALRWFVDRAKPDGFRLDAVKHVPSYFFGKMDFPKDDANWGYGGQAQEQFNISRGFSDWNNHRDTVFNNVQSRDDLMLFGEHLGDPPWKMYYVDAGMRIANDDFLNAVKGNIGGNLGGMDNAYYSVISPLQSVHYVMSHDNNYLWGGDREDAHAVLLAREGLPIVYTDGYNQSGASDGWFPKPAEIPFLGQFNQKYLPNLLEIGRHFGWGYQSSRWDAWDFTSWSRYDDTLGNDDHGVTMIFMMARNYQQNWVHKDVSAIFPEGARLFNYSYHDGPFKIKVSGGKLRNMDDSPIYVAPGKYYAFSWRTPELPQVWGDHLTNEVQPILIYENGVRVGTVTATRKDGRNGDPAFNPYGLSDANSADYTYSIRLPRVTSSSNLAFVARADGSAENVLMKLDGGIDLNSQLEFVTQAPGVRDNPPTVAKDKFLGYEQMKFMYRTSEKFAARSTTNNMIGSGGAETYICTVGTTGFVVNVGEGLYSDGGRSVSWFYHDPAANNQISTNLQFTPPPQLAGGQPVTVWGKIGYAPQPQEGWLYYTTNGIEYPEGSAGVGKGSTRVAPLAFDSNGSVDGGSTSQWWRATLPALPNGTVLRYKVSALRKNAAQLFPWTDNDIEIKKRMETVFAITNFNAGTIPYYPHNDWGVQATGLKEGYHVLRTKAFLGRASGDTSIYRERTQTFYYDTQRPAGVFVTPASDGLTLTGQTYAVKVRTDMSVEELWYKIDDLDAGNDDVATGVDNGNAAWVKAVKGLVTAPLPGQALEQQWEFNYVLIPTSGLATIRTRLREVSSSTNQALTDVAGHYTTLLRTVDTGGNSVKLFVQTPSVDGALVGVGSNLVAHFTRSLVDGLAAPDYKNHFVIDADGVVLTNTSYVFTQDVTSNEHAISVSLPNLYNGDANALHLLTVTFDRPAYPFLYAQRQVLAVADEDSNDDGIPDAWETQWNIPVGSLWATNDDDGDGFLNGQEYVADTDPLSSNQYLVVDSLVCTGSVATLWFPTSSNRNYLVWYTDVLGPSNTWQLATPLTAPIEGTGQIDQFTDLYPNPTNRFFRLEVVIPSP